ncbi:MAG TPA: TolC family protein [Opitutaceae bacterium]|jgi:outer membrane protein
MTFFGIGARLAPGLGAGLALAALVAGCVVSQEKEVHTYRQVLDADQPKPQPLQPNEPLSLERALALANADNEQLASQGETYLQALIAKGRAFSTFMPTVSFEPNFTVEQAPRGQSSPASAGAPAVSAAQAAATQGGYVQEGKFLRRFQAPVVGELTFAPRNVPLYKAAEIGVAQQRQVLLDAQESLLLDVAQTYYQVVISSRQVDVLRHSLALQQARLTDTEGRFKVRLALDLEVSQAQADEAATRALLSHAENDVRNGRRTLALLIGAAAVEGPLDAKALAPAPPVPIDSYVDRAFAGRQDLLAAQNAVEVARYGVKAAVAEYYPSVSLNVAGYLYEENYADASKWNGILSANLPLFTGGAIHADVRDAWSRLRQAALFESYLRREIEQGVRTAYDNVLTSGIVLADLRHEVEAAADAYRQSTGLVRNGLAIPLDVLTAQDTLLNAELQYTAEAFNQTILQLNLIRAAGELDPTAASKLRWSVPEQLPSVP